MAFSILSIVFRDPTPVERAQVVRPCGSIGEAYANIRMLMVAWGIDEPYAPARLENVLSEEDAALIQASLAKRFDDVPDPEDDQNHAPQASTQDDPTQ